MMPKFQVDRGAIPFVLRGANVLAPGLTSEGGCLEEGVEEGQPVQITAEGKINACAVGIAKMSTSKM
jgi:PUA domain protein